MPERGKKLLDFIGANHALDRTTTTGEALFQQWIWRRFSAIFNSVSKATANHLLLTTY